MLVRLAEPGTQAHAKASEELAEATERWEHAKAALNCARNLAVWIAIKTAKEVPFNGYMVLSEFLIDLL